MQEDEQILWRPVLRGMVRAESLTDGSIDLDMILRANEAIDIETMNNIRAEAHAASAK